MPDPATQQLLRSLPQVEEVLNHQGITSLAESFPRTVVADLVRASLESLRQKILLNDFAEAGQSCCLEEIVKMTLQSAEELIAPTLKKVINVSGVVIHTNLGRSVLCEAALQAVLDAAGGYSTLEYDPGAQSRGSRHCHYEGLLCALTGAEAALAVNNNAAAVWMVLSEFAAGREAIVSRGELVEIGGSFRVPDIMQASRSRMVEVGTTNKTHLTDYERALTSDTALFLKVHPSNYTLVGFTQSVEVSALRALANRADHEILVYEDQGSGSLINLQDFSGCSEPTVASSLQKGCDLVSFSGDKLLGGPQAGIIVGKQRYINQLKASPLARVLRLDKMTIAALEATLRLYLNEEKALREIPTLRMLTLPALEVKKRAEQLCGMLQEALPEGLAELSVVAQTARAGGGSLPDEEIASFAVKIAFDKGSAQQCATYLITRRACPVIVRIQKDAILCDPRTLLRDDELVEVVAAFKAYFDSLT
ncbi:MAG: L-seryl-tRNA(Sec) selenium transferase [Coriobacteriales bacterium]|jgi:L-seryl-tRNA(Ser) seleniumtransferase|nr:L-seryl-tRNA(Sec) selenium transferase [Coriobacteriales bacterium]